MRMAWRRLLVLAAVGALLAAACTDDGGSSAEQRGGTANDGAEETDPTRPVPSTTPGTDAAPTPTPGFEGWSDPALAGAPYPGEREGLLTFRGNPTRTYYGRGPVPTAEPDVRYTFPSSGGMCSESSDGAGTRTWCGMGWTGQPAVFDYEDRTWAIFGAYDAAVHFMDVSTGERIIPDFQTGDLIKGSVTVDPDGFPLVYVGSRDNNYRVLSFAGDEPVELWSMNADDFSPTLWNNDWDSSGLILRDHLLVGGENGQFVVVKLNRSMGDDGTPSVAPEVVFNTPSWDQELLSAIGDTAVSVENSPMVLGDVVYFANSGGLVQGWDLSGLEAGEAPTRVFRFWTGDDTDASIVGSADGHLYVASEYERAGTAHRSDEVGQLMKLDPSNPDDPLVWSFFDNNVRPGGIWGTPGIANGMVYVGTNGGRLLGIDDESGRQVWSKSLTGPVWGSPSIVDDVLLIGDCDGVFHAYDVSNPGVDPPELWSVELGGCIEATPAVWEGFILIGTRAGALNTLFLP